MRIHSLVITIAATLALSLGAAGCSNEPDGAPKPDKPAAQASPAGHGAASARPGSHEDWCGEHAVPESQCTRCNPALAAAFKATGDWCKEHGLPESQCLQCNPELKIVRPAKEK